MNPTDSFILILAVIDLLWLLPLIGLPVFLASALFGVYVPEEERGLPQIARMRRRFLRLGLGGALAGAVLAFAAYRLSGGSEGWTLALLLIPQAACIGAAWNVCRRDALALKAERDWKLPVSSKRTAYIGRERVRPASGIRAWAYLLQVAIILVAALLVALNWDRIPDAVPVHFDAAGLPDRYQAKSVGSVFTLTWVQLGLTALFLGIHLSLGRMPQQLDPKDPEGSLRKHNRLRASNAYVLYAVSLIMAIMFSFIQTRITYRFEGTLPIGYFVVFFLLLMIPIVAFFFYVKRRGLEEPGLNRRYGEDGFWRGGLFYYNPDDPSFVTEKRFGFGWTFNFARPLGWIVAASVVLLPMAAVAAAVVFGG